MSSQALFSRTEIAYQIEAARLIAIVRLRSSAGIIEACTAAARGGLRCLEITLSVPGAVHHIAQVAEHVPALLVGAGTVTTPEQVREVVAAGARYIVSPILDRDIIECAHELDVPVIPGCQTPTEMFQAHVWLADFIKLFPTEHLAPNYIKNILAPLPQLKIIPSGGVTPANLGDWLRAGAVGVGVGSALMDDRVIAARDFEAIEQRARALVEAVQQVAVGARSERPPES